jgi:hypothetical protein
MYRVVETVAIAVVASVAPAVLGAGAVFLVIF